jgi:hypothetical protein
MRFSALENTNGWSVHSALNWIDLDTSLTTAHRYGYDGYMSINAIMITKMHSERDRVCALS